MGDGKENPMNRGDRLSGPRMFPGIVTTAWQSNAPIDLAIVIRKSEC